MKSYFQPRLLRSLALLAGIAVWVISLSAQSTVPSIVFVSRQIPRSGTIYWDVPDEMPGVGPRSRFRPAAPGRLLVRESDGRIRVLVDGANPTSASMNLIDVNAPDVSYDGTTIVFAGLPAGAYNGGPVGNPGAWRLYSIKVDGTGLRTVTHSDQQLDLSQFGVAAGGLSAYDDTDPVWLPDGRIAFSSTRWPAFSQYSGVRTTNLYVVDSNGNNLHRITSERNGADRPLVDPLTGKLVYARWWRNHRFPTDDTNTLAGSSGGYAIKDGLTTDRYNHVAAPGMWRNAWQIATINPDGTELALWAGSFRDEEANHAYGGAFAPTGEFFANFFPMYNMTEAAGFGGVRMYRRGAGNYTPVFGITRLTLDYVHPSNPTSYGVFNGTYASEPEVLPDGRLLVSVATDVKQDYGLSIVNADGTGLTRLLDLAGTTELRARVIQPRPLPPVIADRVPATAALLPPSAGGPFDQDGTFTFDALNVYGNAPVDTDIVSAPAVGSANVIRFFIDHQRTSQGSFPEQDWPILLEQSPVGADGSVRNTTAPANVPLFEQLRDLASKVPTTRGPQGINGAAHVAGMNFGKPGAVARCVGCHAGHTLIPVPSDPEEAKWSNLAPGASVSVSSTRDANQNLGLTDRRVRKGERWRYWTSAPESTRGQWVQLTFPVPVAVREIRLYNPVAGGEANSSVVVTGTTIRLYSDVTALTESARATTGELSEDGTSVRFGDVLTRAVKIEISGVTGTFYGAHVASLAEVEVIAKGLPRDASSMVLSSPRNLRLSQ